MCQATLINIVAQLSSDITCQDIDMWPPLTLEKQVAIIIMKLATSTIYV